MVLGGVASEFQGQIGHAHDPIHGGSYFMAHIGKEVTFGQAGRLRQLPTFMQLPVRHVALCFVRNDTYHTGYRPTVGAGQRPGVAKFTQDPRLGMRELLLKGLQTAFTLQSGILASHRLRQNRGQGFENSFPNNIHAFKTKQCLESTIHKYIAP